MDREVSHRVFPHGLVHVLTRAILAATLPASPLAAATHRLGSGDTMGISAIRVVGTLVFCLLLAAALILLLKRMQTGADDNLINRLRMFVPAKLPAGRIAVLETRRISTHADLCLMRTTDREFAVIVSANYAQILSDNPVTDGSDTDRS